MRYRQVSREWHQKFMCCSIFFQLIHHDSMRLGRSKEEFLEINGPQMATATHVIVLLSDAAATSPFVFHEVLFADWLGKKIVTAMFKNSWYNLRPSMKAVLGNRSINIIQLFSIHIQNVIICIAVQTFSDFIST